ncbi:hypothetical protein [Fodinibius sediminis]|uniref:Ribbon-helix-helix protein, copG family n=1 Tax=Fodinibius sediminis TaxID=1214077 RepID=A0A521CBU0_9BACT|nr:hypothetical protein [Fodinibius sediminis]SMO56907.1 hypothetical protein SAMN06265218_105245 [Fodinibius sediminis]
MADDEFNIDELISSDDVAGSNTRKTNNTSTTDNSDSSLHPFSVRLDQEYVDIIKALAWWKRISQREFIENCINYSLEKMDEDHLETILNRFNKEG